jgi:enoyl-CoA hydratase/carnithine racemase
MDQIKISKSNGYQVIEMCWSSQHPGFQVSTFDLASKALQEADLDPDIACTVFFGIPRCFCLGTDATSFALGGDLGRLSESALQYFRCLINAKKPLIAAVDGTAVGLGMTMLFHFDAVFSTPESSFKAPFVEWGLAPEAASSMLFPQTLGYRKAFDMFCLGSQMSAVEAERRGLVTRVVSSGDLRKTTLEAAEHLARLPQDSMRITRELMREQRPKLVKRARLENDLFQELLNDQATQRRLRTMARATRIAMNIQVREKEAMSVA